MQGEDSGEVFFSFFRTFFFCHLMKEEMRKRQSILNTLLRFWGTNRAAETLLTKQVEVSCVSQPLPWVFIVSVKFL